MSSSGRPTWIGGILLILIGAAVLAWQLSPQLQESIQIQMEWPLWIVGVGALLFLLALVFSEPGMAVPAFIVGGIGSLLYWQNATGNWESWAYAWALIPGFVGLGIVVSGLLQAVNWNDVRSGGGMILISLIMFLVFAGLFGGLDILGPYWPVLLILLGIIVLIRPLVGSRDSTRQKPGGEP